MTTTKRPTAPLLAAALGAAALGLSGSWLVSRSSYAATAPAAAIRVPRAAGSSPASSLPDFSSLVSKYGPAVVNITVTGTMPTQLTPKDFDFRPNSPFGQFFRQFPLPQPRAMPSHGEGSGFIVNPDGIILTNAHVVEGAHEVTVRLTDQREFTAKVLGSDKQSDVAVLKIDASNLPTVRLGNDANLKPGQWVIAIGAPFGFVNSVTAGIVSAKQRVLPDDGYVPFIQTDVPINPGNSGGPLFDLDGNVVGINSQIYSRSGGYQGVSFAIPIDVAVDVSRQIEAHGRVEHGRLGVTIQQVNQSLAETFGLDRPRGALVASVDATGPGGLAGLKPGDVILSVDGKAVSRSTELPVMIAESTPGSTVRLDVWRDRTERTIDVKLGDMAGTHIAANESSTEHGRLGLAVRPLTPQEREQADAKGGLLVEDSTGPAAAAGIQPGDIVLSANNTPVTSAAQLGHIVDHSGHHVALLVKHGDTQIFVPVSLG